MLVRAVAWTLSRPTDPPSLIYFLPLAAAAAPPALLSLAGDLVLLATGAGGESGSGWWRFAAGAADLADLLVVGALGMVASFCWGSKRDENATSAKGKQFYEPFLWQNESVPSQHLAPPLQEFLQRVLQTSWNETPRSQGVYK